MTTEKLKIVPLEYAAMGSQPHHSIDPSLVPDEGLENDLAQLLAGIERLDGEKAEILRGRELEIHAARSAGYETGRQEEREQHEQNSRAIRDGLAMAIEQFAASRDTYVAEVEREVVRLALAIAARILNREAQMDPLLLSGAVRVALGQLSESTEVQLHVPRAEAEVWTEMLRLMPNLPLRPAVVSDDGLRAGECKMKTQLGTVDLGISAQLEEIERGFFDLLEHRTKVSHAEIA
jgi:flagellar assembly protein FliH